PRASWRQRQRLLRRQCQPKMRDGEGMHQPALYDLSAVKCLVVVPAYNEEKSIAGTVADIRAAIGNSRPDAAIVVVNDGSRDGTSAAARATGAVVLDLPFNLDIGGSVQAGLMYAARD